MKDEFLIKLSICSTSTYHKFDYFSKKVNSGFSVEQAYTDRLLWFDLLILISLQLSEYPTSEDVQVLYDNLLFA